MRKISKKQIGAMGLAVMMTAQSPAMAAEIETSQTENTVVTQEATQEDSQEEATVVEDVSAAEQETVTEQETVSEQDSVMVQETASEENAIEETSIEVVTEETDELTTEAVEEGKNIVAAQSAITDGWHRFWSSPAPPGAASAAADCWQSPGGTCPRWLPPDPG